VKGDAGENCTIADGDKDGEIILTCGENETTLYKALCGKEPYDPDEKFCVGVDLYELCGGKTYDPAKFECVENQLQEKVVKCNGVKYDPETQFCAKRGTTEERPYKMVNIGEQTWMAENLNYETENSWCGGGSGTTEGDCSIYGRLYTWAAAINNSTVDAHGNIQGVCPDGWHLPSKTEFEKLITNVDADLNGTYGYSNKAGTALKSTSGWYENGNGTNASGFSALPVGFRYSSGNFLDNGYYAYFWSATEYSSYNAYYMYMYYDIGSARLDDYDKNYGFSVRCLQD